MSSAAMEDNYDITNRSRQRDRDVLAAANRAIYHARVDTEVHSTPRGAVAALRVTRGHSTPPPATKFSRTERLQRPRRIWERELDYTYKYTV